MTFFLSKLSYIDFGRLSSSILIVVSGNYLRGLSWDRFLKPKSNTGFIRPQVVRVCLEPTCEDLCNCTEDFCKDSEVTVTDGSLTLRMYKENDSFQVELDEGPVN